MARPFFLCAPPSIQAAEHPRAVAKAGRPVKAVSYSQTKAGVVYLLRNQVKAQRHIHQQAFWNFNKNIP